MKWWAELFPEPERRAYAQMEKGFKFFSGTRPASWSLMSSRHLWASRASRWKRRARSG